MAELRATFAGALTLSGAQLGAVVVGVLAGIAVLFGSTFASLVDVWTQSDTFVHCFAIAPISLFLVWRSRDDLRLAPKKPSFVGLGAVLILSLAWLVSTIAELQIGQQLAAVLLIPAAVVAVLGIEASRRISFPLAFLVFAVPFGEALIPALMDFTASFTVAALRLTGIPVLREGFFFKIPSGDFEVAKACSGIRYLIACSMLGVLYSYLSFASWRKRAIFVALSVIAPIIANGVRAYLIVMIAHLSDMRLAAGVDHLIYGWLFFGVLVALLFWAGNAFADPPTAHSVVALGDEPAPRGAVAAPIVAAALTVAFAALGPSLLHAWLDIAPREARAPALPTSMTGWDGPRAPTAAWRRPVPRGGLTASGLYSNAKGAVELTMLAFQPGAAEVVGSIPTLVDEARWLLLEMRSSRASALDFAPNELVLRAPHGYAVIWYWYVIGTSAVAPDWKAKVVEGWAAIRHGRADTTLVVLSAEAADVESARAALASYLETAFESINACAAGAAPRCAGR